MEQRITKNKKQTDWAKESKRVPKTKARVQRRKARIKPKAISYNKLILKTEN